MQYTFFASAVAQPVYDFPLLCCVLPAVYQTLLDFKNGLRTLMIATSVAGRGLDVKNLVLVVNYNCPNHLEDYIHRVGRTGRAGKKGTAITFITPDEDKYAPDLVKALTDSNQVWYLGRR